MKKCSNIEHQETNAIAFCCECKIYMCNKCEKRHSDFFKNLHENKIIKDINTEDMFTGICDESEHINELKYFCKDHNKLCCVECIARIKTKNNGQHKDCNVCLIKDIEEEKKSKLKENIKILENLSINFKQSIEDLKNLFEKINADKEKLKTTIQNIFTKLRNELNNREDELLLEIDNQYEKIFFKESVIKLIIFINYLLEIIIY